MAVMNSKKMDMTQGSLWDKILIFAIPLAASSILQQLFNSVDTAVVGRFASSQALAAVGSNSSLISLMINLFIGISLGSNVVIAHYIGQKSEDNIHAAVDNKWIFCNDSWTVHCKTGTASYGNTRRCNRAGSSLSEDISHWDAVYNAV